LLLWDSAVEKVVQAPFCSAIPHGDAMITPVGTEEVGKSVLRLQRSTRDEALQRLSEAEASEFGGAELTMMHGELNDELVEGLFRFCGQAAPEGGARLSLAHNDLGSGTECEQRLFELTAERRVRESEKVFAEKVKRDSSKEKDFSVSAAKRRKGQEGIDAANARLAAIDEELGELEKRKVETPWYVLFTHLQATPCNAIRHLNLSNCGLHATALTFLTKVLLELEQRAEGARISWIVLDGNSLGDAAMGALASFLRLSSSVEVLQLRSVGVTEQGVSELVAGLVTNRSLRLLDMRSNGLCSLDAARAAVSGVQRFNTTAQVLLT